MTGDGDMRLLAIILNVVLLVNFGIYLLMRGDWQDMNAYQWGVAAMVLSCPIVNLIAMRETVKYWVLRHVQKSAEEGNLFRG